MSALLNRSHLDFERASLKPLNKIREINTPTHGYDDAEIGTDIFGQSTSINDDRRFLFLDGMVAVSLYPPSVLITLIVPNVDFPCVDRISFPEYKYVLVLRQIYLLDSLRPSSR